MMPLLSPFYAVFAAKRESMYSVGSILTEGIEYGLTLYLFFRYLLGGHIHQSKKLSSFGQGKVYWFYRYSPESRCSLLWHSYFYVSYQIPIKALPGTICSYAMYARYSRRLLRDILVPPVECGQVTPMTTVIINTMV